MKKILFFKKSYRLLAIASLILILMVSELPKAVASSVSKAASVTQLITDNRISIDVKSGTLSQIMAEICTKSGIKFGFIEGIVIDETKLYSLTLNNVTTKTAITTLLTDTNYTFVIEDDVVLIVEKPFTAQPQEQKITVKGKVVDNENKPVVGATVIIESTNEGAITDDAGQFTLQAKLGDVLVVSFTGYLEQNVTVTSDVMNVTLEVDNLMVDDVVVTGLVTKPKSGFAGAATTITKKELQRVSTGNIFTTLSMLDAGFKIEENNIDGSNPNTLPDFTIRGRGSFQEGSTQPLFILDGFQVSAQKIFDMDINRIETITLLKDASATILYGSRASNGVIVIETVAPQPGEIRVSYDFKPTIAIVDLTDYDLMNASEKLQYELEAGLYEGYDFDDTMGLQQEYFDKYHNVISGVDTYWLSQPVRDAISHTHSLYVDGGGDEFRYGVDVGYNKNNGVMKESGRDRFNAGISLIYRIRDRITVKNQFSYAHTNAYDSPYGSFSTYGQLNPYERPRNDNGELIPILSDGTTNPLYDAELPNRSTNITQEIREQLSVDWFISKELRLVGQFALSKTIGNGDLYRSPFSSEFVLSNGYDDKQQETYVAVEDRGLLSKTNSDGFNLSGNFTLSYNKLFQQKHQVMFSVGSEVSTNNQQSYGFTVTGFSDDRYTTPNFAIQYIENGRASGYESLTRSVGVFANVNYIYDNRFFFDGSFRYDGSSQFGSEERFAPYWSMGAGWNLHNEQFVRDNTTAFDILKLRYSYGVTGNMEFSAYQAKTMYQFVTSDTYDTLTTISLMSYGNPNLSWQSQYQHNAGFDISMLENRVRASFNYYHKTTSGMLTDVTVAPSLGIPGNSYKENIGKIQNKGYDATINAVLVRDVANAIEWGVNLQMAHNKNTLLEISKELEGINAVNNLNKNEVLPVYEQGQSMSAIKAVQSLGIDPQTGDEVYLSRDGITTFEWDANDKVVAGDEEPKVFGNLSSNVQWGGWNLNMVFRYRLGADYYNYTLSDRVEGANPQYNADRRVLNDRWKEVGQVANYRNIADYSSTFVSTRFIQKEQLFEAGSLSLSYEFAKSYLKKLGIGTLKLSLYANDLFRFSSIEQERGLDYPFQRSFVFGLNVSF